METRTTEKGSCVTAPLTIDGALSTTMSGVFTGGVLTIFGNPIDTADNFKLALKLAAEGKLKVLIDKVLPLKDARRAHEIVEQRSGIGKVVLTP